MKTILQHTLLLNLLLCWSMPHAFSNTVIGERIYETPTQMSALPQLNSPADQATNVSLTPNLQWTDTGSSYTVEVYNCNPDYNKVGKFLTQSGTFTKETELIYPNSVIDDDFSGITYNASTGKFFAVINGNCEILELEPDGTIIRRIELEYQRSNGNYFNDGNPNNSYDDTEGIVWIGGTEFFVVEEREGRVTKINIPDGVTYIPATNQYIQLNDIDDWGNNRGLEGISYNPATNEIIVVKEKNPRDLYIFEIPTSFPAVATVSDALVNNFGFGDLAGLHHFGNNSGLSNMNISDHFLILSHEESEVVETDNNGVEYGRLNFTDIVGNHPEGITVDNLGNIYIAAERNEFYKYSNSALDLNPFGLDPNTIFAANYITANSLSLPAGILDGSTQYCWRVKDNDTGTWSDYYSFTTEMIDCSTDRDALIALYNANDGANWGDPDGCGGIGWDLSQPMSSWYGVTLNANGCVIGLELIDNCLEGVLPPELGNLSQLQILNLELNHDLTGPIPPELGQLTSLRTLDLSQNDHTGTIPPELGTLINLEKLDLQNNLLVGTIPDELGDIGLSLEHLDLSNNSLSGTISSELGRFRNLEYLNLASNNFQGTIPFGVRTMPLLKTLNVNNNNLSGNIPDLSGLTSIETLFLYNNDFDGSIPASIGSLTTLYWLVLGRNDLTGGIPSFLENLPVLGRLNLSYNTLGGSINPALCNLNNLHTLDLQNTRLTGTIPDCLGDLPDLTFLYLEGNMLTGEIPSAIINSGRLAQLSTRNNQLSGCYDQKLSELCNSLEPNYNTNYFISDGNNFDLPWNNFCSTGTACVIPCDVRDREALIALYDATDGANWNITWDLNQPMTSWYGVTLSIDGCVTQLDLSSNNLNGTIPPELEDLSNLEQLLLANNQLSGNIPPELGNLASLLILDISNNQLSGSIPVELGNLPTLYLFYANSNQLTGSIPDELSNVLQHLHLGNNQLTGAIPTTLNNDLRELYLSYNQLSGLIPTTIGNMTNIRIIDLESNQLNGTIPSTFGNLTNLERLQLADNQLSGCYDDNLQNLCNLNAFISIDAFNNFDMPWADFCSLGICVPCSTDYIAMVAFANSITSWGSTSPWDVTQPLNTWDGITLHPDGCVKSINLDENNMAGTIPPELGNLSSIEFLHLGDNNLSGNIPPELGNLITLTYLNFSGNALTGSVPAEFGNLTSLLQLYLSFNQLSGSIPPELGNLTELSQFSVKSNNLTGNIPPELGNMTKLNSLSLNNNQLSGLIPSTFGNLSFLQFLALYNNQLSGCYDNQLLNLCGQLNPNTNINFYISNGNSFNLPWEDFCNNGSAACAPINCSNQQDQYTALRAFYLSTDGDNWDNNANWPNAAFFNANPTLPAGMIVANWYGIDVNADGCVTRMDFDDDNIQGTIPPEFGNLTDLEYLELGSNRLSGSLPAEMGNLSSLTYMNLSNNSSLTGNIPPELGNLGSIETIYFNFNNFSGSIPPELGNLTNLTTLSIRRNQLSGNIPDELGNLTNLIYLGLDDNQLTGTIPASLGSITSLTNLGLKNNQLSGCYDPVLQNLCSQLTNYYNSNAQISNGNNFDAPWEDFCGSGAGECVPLCTPDYNAMVAFHSAITDWGLMTAWDLTQPMNTWEGVVLNAAGCVEEITIDEEHVIGTLPPELGDLSSLIKLDLGNNNFAGSIPPELGNLTNLAYLNLSDNNLTGNIPSELANLSSMTMMYMTYNQLSGNIPPELGNLSNLMTLSLGTNQLSGNIPPELGNLTNLISLTLRANQLTGSIPGTLGSMPNLTSLSLHDNQLSGCYDSNLTALCGQLSAYHNSNARISDGNNLDAPWEDFCTNGTAACDLCPTDLNLSTPLSTGTYQASQTLNSESTVPTGASVEFKAGDAILLDKGFTVEPGSEFSGEVGEDCSGN